MGLFSALKERAQSMLDGVMGGLGGYFGGGGKYSKSDFGANPAVKVKINEKDIKNEQVLITGVLVDSGTPPEAGTCEVELDVSGSVRLNNNTIGINEEFSKIKVGQKLEVQMASVAENGKPNNLTTVFKGFVESMELEIMKEGNTRCIIRGMDAKMWMMANILTKSKGNNKTYKNIVEGTLRSYDKQLSSFKVYTEKNSVIKSTVFQINESDYDFLCRIANLTGSLFFIDNAGKCYFCAPSSLTTGAATINFKDDVISNIKTRASVWGTPKSVTVKSVDSSDPSKALEAKSTSAPPIGSGKGSNQLVSQNYSSSTTGTRMITLSDNSIGSKNEAQALADAIYSERNLRLAETEIRLMGNPKLGVGQAFKISGFSKPFDNTYLAIRCVHKWGVYSDEGQYFTELGLTSNKFNPQGG